VTTTAAGTATRLTTLGVAIAVPDPWGAQLQDYRTSLGDDAARDIPTHITLLPPFEVEEDAVPSVERHLAAASGVGEAFEIRLRGTGTFRPVSPVVFVTLAEGISQCELLAGAVRSGPVVVDQEFPFHPHVTIAHHLPDALMDRAFDELADFDCGFTVDRFHLYVHQPGTGWVPRRHFALAAPSAG
jgi:2'-5' RNA ligase